MEKGKKEKDLKEEKDDVLRSVTKRYKSKEEEEEANIYSDSIVTGLRTILHTHPLLHQAHWHSDTHSSMHATVQATKYTDHPFVQPFIHILNHLFMNL